MSVKMKTSEATKHYQNIFEKSRHSRILSSISALLDWDQETYMPIGAATIRSEQMKVLAGLIHKSRTSPSFAKALSQLIDLKSGEILVKGLSSPQKAAVKQWHRDYVKETCLPSSFVEEFAQVCSQSVTVWRSAKNQNTFHTFAPYLDKLVYMNRKKAELLGYENHPYDALLDLYEPDTTTAEIEGLFNSLKKSLLSLLKKIKQAKPIDNSFLYGKFEEKKQLALSAFLMEALGHDKSKGRLDISSHPFSTGMHPTDSRITTRIHPTSLISNISTTLHECGHGLYEMGLSEEHYGSPLGEPISLGIHESQSRWWETLIGQSSSFWKYFLPVLKKAFPKELESITVDKIYRAVNKVHPSLIRVESDEVTYSLHVILRFELEKELIEGSLSVRDIPEAWNAKMQELLGVTPSNNTEGCLQDIHWAMGAFGYFPTYTLGNLYAAHLFTAFEHDHPTWQNRLAKGDLLFIKQWLNTHIHQYGRQYGSKELLKKVTGKAFSADAFNHYINRKYTDLYKLK